MTELAEPRLRGDLTMSDAVIEKTAGQILKGMSVVGGTSSGFLGIGSKSSMSTRPSVNVSLSGLTCTLEVTLGLKYPLPITETTETVRNHLRTELETLTGVSVRQVDIVVSWLRAPYDSADPGVRSLQ